MYLQFKFIVNVCRYICYYCKLIFNYLYNFISCSLYLIDSYLLNSQDYRRRMISAQFQKLNPRGIKELLTNDSLVRPVIVQVSNIQFQTDELSYQISDGNYKIKAFAVKQLIIYRSNRFMTIYSDYHENAIISITNHKVNQKDNQISIALNKFTVVCYYAKAIGNPEFVQTNYEPTKEQTYLLDNTLVKEPCSNFYQQTQTIVETFANRSIRMIGSHFQNSDQMKRQQSTKNQKNPPQRIERRQESPGPQINAPMTKIISETKKYNKIKDLTLESKNILLLCKINKQSFNQNSYKILTIQLIDDSNITIQGVFWRDLATKFNSIIKTNNIYEIKFAVVQLKDKYNKHTKSPIQLKFNIKTQFHFVNEAKNPLVIIQQLYAERRCGQTFDVVAPLFYIEEKSQNRTDWVFHDVKNYSEQIKVIIWNNLIKTDKTLEGKICILSNFTLINFHGKLFLNPGQNPKSTIKLLQDTQIMSKFNQKNQKFKEIRLEKIKQSNRLYQIQLKEKQIQRKKKNEQQKQRYEINKQNRQEEQKLRLSTLRQKQQEQNRIKPLAMAFPRLSAQLQMLNFSNYRSFSTQKQKKQQQRISDVKQYSNKIKLIFTQNYAKAKQRGENTKRIKDLMKLQKIQALSQNKHNIEDLSIDLQNWQLICQITKIDFHQYESKTEKYKRLCTLNLQLMDSSNRKIVGAFFSDDAVQTRQLFKQNCFYKIIDGKIIKENYKNQVKNQRFSMNRITFDRNSSFIKLQDVKVTENSQLFSANLLKLFNSNKLTQNFLRIFVILVKYQEPSSMDNEDQNQSLKMNWVFAEPKLKTVFKVTLQVNDIQPHAQFIGKQCVLYNFGLQNGNSTLTSASNFTIQFQQTEEAKQLADKVMQQFKSYESLSKVSNVLINPAPKKRPGMRVPRPPSYHYKTQY